MKSELGPHCLVWLQTSRAEGAPIIKTGYPGYCYAEGKSAPRLIAVPSIHGGLAAQLSNFSLPIKRDMKAVEKLSTSVGTAVVKSSSTCKLLTNRGSLPQASSAHDPDEVASHKPCEAVNLISPVHSFQPSLSLKYAANVLWQTSHVRRTLSLRTHALQCGKVASSPVASSLFGSGLRKSCISRSASKVADCQSCAHHVSRVWMLLSARARWRMEPS